MFEARHPSPNHIRSSGSDPGIKIELNEDDELAILRGDSRLVSQKRNYDSSTSGSSGSASVSPPAAQGSLPASFPSHQLSSGSAPPNDATENSETLDWTALMDAAGMMQQQQQSQGVTATSLATAVEDGTFANLEPEAFLDSVFSSSTQGQAFPDGQDNMAVDDWNPYIEAVRAQFFGGWKF